MPIVRCDMVECKHNQGGECVEDTIELNYSATCVSYEYPIEGERK